MPLPVGRSLSNLVRTSAHASIASAKPGVSWRPRGAPKSAARASASFHVPWQQRLFSSGAGSTAAPGHSAPDADATKGEMHTFQADTTKLLDIVSHSLYSERDVFLRELVSNASDALQKHAPDFQGPREIKVEANKVNKTLTIVDSGVGMSRQEMLTNLGTIGKSGSGALGKQNTGIIGQFGVGFYSVFMVAKSVAVTSRRAGEAEAFTWRSEGKDSFTIRPAAAADAPPDFVGTKVELELREDAHEFCEDARVREVIKRYSNFVAFPVYVDGERANASEALWTEDPSQVGEERYAAFYKSTFGAFDVPAMTVHFRTDVPLDIKALLYIGKDHDERVGMGRVRPGVALHARKVLVESASEALLPGWARFVKGVVDSEDLPLSISRESATSNALVTKIGKVVTKKLLRFLRDKAKENAAAYNLFWDRHAQFIKEGVCTDFANQPDLAKLLRFDTSLLKPTDAPVSIDEVASRCTAGQKKLYYLSAPNRAMAELSPYYEVFKRAGVEVMFLYHTLDDFCMANLRTYEGRELVAAESGEIEAGLLGDKPAGKEGEENALGDAELCAWLKLVLGDLVSQVQVTDRLKDSPALIVDHESASLRRMMKLVDQHEKGAKALDSRGLGKQRMEVNPRHPIIAGLNRTRAQDPALAALLARNVFDGALVAAGLVDDPREMIPRWNGLVEQLLQKAQSNKPAAA